MKQPTAPKHLSEESQDFWRQVLDDFNLDAHHQKILQSACESWDRILEARMVIEEHGAFFNDRFGQPKENPACKSERDNKVIFCRLIRELGLDLEQPEAPRPPAQY